MPYKHNLFIILICLLIGFFSLLSNVTAQQCTDNDNDGYAVEGGLCGAPDCNDTDPLVHPEATEGPNGDPTCSDAFDNDCDKATDNADNDCSVSLTILKTTVSPAIDGDLSEYIYANSATFAPETGENTVTVRALWDDNALYIAYEVTDTQLNTEVPSGGIWIDDSVEWFIDQYSNGGNSSNPDAPYMLEDDYQILVNILNNRSVYQGLRNGNTTTISDSGLQSAVLITGTNNNNADTDIGYAVEIEVPWTYIGSVAPVRDSVVGMGFAVNDNDAYFIDSVMWPNLSSIAFQNASNWQKVLISTKYIPTSTCIDTDGDGYGNPGHSSCTKGSATDCNDNNASISPGAMDSNCNNIDENCDGFVDEGYVVTITNCGYSNCSSTGLVTCLDGVEIDTCITGSAHPEGPADDPTCYDSIDNDCDGETDLDDTNCIKPCVDNDGDGFGKPGNPDCPNGPVIDCNDNDPGINPDHIVNCDITNNNCYSYAALTWKAPVTNMDGSDLHDLAGYRIYYGESFGNYTDVKDVGNNTCHVIGNLTPQEWCFAVTAYDIRGNESDISGEACKFIN